MLYFLCVVAVCVLCLFLGVLWVGLQSVIVAFPGRILLLLERTVVAANGSGIEG